MGILTGAAKHVVVRQVMGVPLITGGISWDEALVRHSGSCQPAASSLCPALDIAKHRSASVTRSCLPT